MLLHLHLLHSEILHRFVVPLELGRKKGVGKVVKYCRARGEPSVRPRSRRRRLLLGDAGDVDRLAAELGDLDVVVSHREVQNEETSRLLLLAKEGALVSELDVLAPNEIRALPDHEKRCDRVQRGQPWSSLGSLALHSRAPVIGALHDS